MIAQILRKASRISEIVLCRLLDQARKLQKRDLLLRLGGGYRGVIIVEGSPHSRLSSLRYGEGECFRSRLIGRQARIGHEPGAFDEN